MEIDAIIEEIRTGRFAHGVRCPRCDSARAYRWGSFSGRRRYRCRECGRTFSDLTATPAAYLKKPALLPEFAGAMTQGLSLRGTASRIAISTSTAFRWRHRLCHALAARRSALTGVIETIVRRLPESRKGDRMLDRAPRRRGYDPARVLRQAVCVVIAADRSGGVLSGCVTRPWLEPVDLATLLDPNVDGALTVVAAQGTMGPICRYVRQRGGVYQNARNGPLAGPLDPLCQARSCLRRWTRWMRGFRGVATKHLDHYLAWHRWLEAAGPRDFAGILLRWPLPGAA